MELQIDPEFKRLIKPLQTKEYLQLENNIIMDGCRDAIITWNGIIIDGHNRYEICHRHNIPFRIHEMEFDCRESVLSWICANQLGRRNISEETRKYLIGVQYHTDKVAASKRNSRGVNQYNCDDFIQPDMTSEEYERALNKNTADRIADENHISHGTVQKYAIYSAALDEIKEIEPELVERILSGDIKISHKNVVEVSKFEPKEIRKFYRYVKKHPEKFVRYSNTRNAVSTGRREPDPDKFPKGPSIKDMPVFDPDAEISSLTLTIPSWSSSIERTKSKADLSIVSDKARANLISALYNLQNCVEGMLKAIKEDK